MTAPGLRAILAACLLAHAASALGATYVLDDSASQVLPPNAQWQWAPGSMRTGVNTLHMDVRVNVRIDTRAWAGRAGRIYMVLSQDGGGPVTAEWETQGRLLGGRLTPGERALVFSGTVPAPLLEDTLRVRLTADSRLIDDNARRYAFHFELDTP